MMSGVLYVELRVTEQPSPRELTTPTYTGVIISPLSALVTIVNRKLQ